jgi:hypothetical protein
MHGRPHRHFDGLQIETASFAASTKDEVQPLLYFARDFLADGFRCFFS